MLTSSFIRYRQTPLLERVLLEHISRLDICYMGSIHAQAKAKCSLPQLGILAKFDKRDFIAMLFLLTLSSFRKRMQNYKHFFIRQNFFCQSYHILCFYNNGHQCYGDKIFFRFLGVFSCNSNILCNFVPIWSLTPNRYDLDVKV